MYFYFQKSMNYILVSLGCLDMRMRLNFHLENISFDVIEPHDINFYFSENIIL